MTKAEVLCWLELQSKEERGIIISILQRWAAAEEQQTYAGFSEAMLSGLVMEATPLQRPSAERAQALADLTRLTEDLGGYDKEYGIVKPGKVKP